MENVNARNRFYATLFSFWLVIRLDKSICAGYKNHNSNRRNVVVMQFVVVEKKYRVFVSFVRTTSFFIQIEPLTVDFIRYYFFLRIFTVLNEELKQNQPSGQAVGQKVFFVLSWLSILLLSHSHTHTFVHSFTLACQFKTFKFLTPAFFSLLSFVHKLFFWLWNINDFNSFSFF